MECATGGFRALRSHVKAAKSCSSHCASSLDVVDEIDRSESPQSPPELMSLATDVEEKALGSNQELLCEQEKHLTALRVAVAKEHQALQARERSIRSMENTLNDEMERIAEKERNLDTRIVEITRLEARLHEALLLQEQNCFHKPQQAEVLEPQSSTHDDREALIRLQERKLALSRRRLEEKEKHLQSKERALNEKEGELANFQIALDCKSRKYNKYLKRIEEREAGIVKQERALAAQTLALEQFQQRLSRQHEITLLAQEDYSARNAQLQEKINAAAANQNQDHDYLLPNSASQKCGAGEEMQQGPTVETPLQQLKRKGTFGRFFR